MGFELFPKVESDYAKASVVLPFGTAVEKTQKIQEILVSAAQKTVAENGGDNLSVGIYARINGNTTEVQLYLTPPKQRPISTAEVTRIWREKVGILADVESIKFESDAGGPGRGSSIEVELSHRDIKVLEQASEELAEALAYYPNVVDIDDGFSPESSRLILRSNRKAAEWDCSHRM